VLSNFLAGVQLAVAQPIRIDDAVIVENESGISKTSRSVTSWSGCGICGGWSFR
jgi:hypothetical protein